MKRFLYTLLLTLATTFGIVAQEVTDSLMVQTQTIADKLNESDNASVIQPDKLNQRLIKSQTDNETSVTGYRIQAFSGNNARTAKRDADARAAAISNRFPQYSTYVTFDAPYWRLKVGDFTEYEDAAAVLSDLKRVFPKFARELRLVRDKIKVAE